MRTQTDSLGALLRETRQAKKLSLEEVSKATKISLTVLNALEEEDWGKLPSGVYARTFVRAYGNFLGIQREALEQLESVQRVRPQTPAIVAPKTPLSALGAKARPSVKNMRWAAYLGAGALIFALAINFFARQIFSTSKEVSPPDTAPATQQPEAGQSGLRQEIPAVPPVQIRPAVPPASSVPVTEKKKMPVVTPGEGLDLEIVATDKVWLRIKADNLLLFEGTLAKNERQSWEAQREFLVRMGSAGAVAMFLNGVELEGTGKKGEVKTVVIGKEGIVKTR